MRLPEHRVLPLEPLQPPDLARAPPVAYTPRCPAPEGPLACFLPPPRQHEGMNLQGIGHCLYLHPGMRLSFTAVRLNSAL